VQLPPIGSFHLSGRARFYWKVSRPKSRRQKEEKLDTNKIIEGCAQAKTNFDIAWDVYTQTLTDYAMPLCAEIESAGMLDFAIGKYTVSRSGSRSYYIDESVSIHPLPIPAHWTEVFLFGHRVAELTAAWSDYLEAQDGTVGQQPRETDTFRSVSEIPAMTRFAMAIKEIAESLRHEQAVFEIVKAEIAAEEAAEEEARAAEGEADAPTE